MIDTIGRQSNKAHIYSLLVLTTSRYKQPEE
jgi:hypothetical protein